VGAVLVPDASVIFRLYPQIPLIVIWSTLSSSSTHPDCFFLCILLRNRITPLNLCDVLPFRQTLALQDMVRNDSALLAMIVVCIFNVVDAQVVKAANTEDVE